MKSTLLAVLRWGAEGGRRGGGAGSHCGSNTAARMTVMTGSLAHMSVLVEQAFEC